MNKQMFHISTVYFLAGILGAVLVLLVLTKNTSKKVIPFIILIFVASYYSILYGIELTLQSPLLILSAIKFEYIGIALIPPLWLIFVITYIRRDKMLKLPVYAALFAIPVIVILVSQSPAMIPLLYQNVGFAFYKDLLLISITPGPIYLLNFSYFVVTFLAGILMLFDYSGHAHGIINRQIKIITLSGLVILFAFIFQVYWFGPAYNLDVTPLAFLFTLLMAFVALFHYRLFSLVPVAYDSVFKKLPTGLIITDNLGVVVQSNEIANEILKSGKNPVEGKILGEVCPEWDEFTTFIKGASEETSKDYEDEIIQKTDKKNRIFHIQRTNLQDRRGVTEGSIITLYDITTQKEAEITIKESEKRFRELFEQSPVAYVALDIDGRITDINPEFTHMTGYTEKDIINKYYNKFVPEKTYEQLKDQYYQYLDTGYIYLDLEIFSKDGKKLIVFLSSRIQKDISGKPVRIHAILHDITERKMTETALSQANKKLNLLSSITRHDILNQITVLKGYLELTDDYIKSSDNPDPVLVKYTQKEADSAENISQQIEFTADYQDIGVNMPIWQNVSQTFSDSLTGLNVKDKQISVKTGKLEIYADPLLKKVFYNLVENTLNYGEKVTKINLSAEIINDGLILKYTDDGSGVPKEEKENIFLRKYFRHSGLGLFLSREILSITEITIKETGVFGENAVFEIFVPKGKYKYE